MLIGVGAVALLLWEPHIEGRNAHASLLEIYFHDPFLAYAYIASVSFFVGLYQSFKVLGYARQNRTSSKASVNALRAIKYCAIALVAFVVLGEIFIMLGSGDDRAGGVFIGILIIFGSIVIASAIAMLEGVLQNVVNIKSTILKLENGFWQAAGNAEFYKRHFAEDGLMILPFEGGTLNKSRVVEAVSKAEPWKRFQINEPIFTNISSSVLALTYKAIAHRKGQPAYNALISSVYVRNGSAWQLLLHQQTPINPN